jgi:hypothetical protein
MSRSGYIHKLIARSGDALLSSAHSGQLCRHASGVCGWRESPFFSSFFPPGATRASSSSSTMSASDTSSSQETSKTGTDGSVPVLNGTVRTRSGSRAARKLRDTNRVPGNLLLSLSAAGGDAGVVARGGGDGGSHVLLSFDKKDIESIHGKIGSYGWGCQVFDLRILDEDGKEKRRVRVLGRQIHVTGGSAEPENVTMIEFPPDRKVKVDVPLRTFGRELSPGIRAGGRVNWIRRTVPCVVQGALEVPQFFEVDISDLQVNDKVLWSSLNVPDGVTVTLKDPRQPLLKMARK